MNDNDFSHLVGKEDKEIKEEPLKKQGRKYDDGKLLWHLLPIESIESIVDVLSYGAAKYDSENWKYVENAKDRYFSAFMRHVVAYRKGEIYDKESGKPHLSHAMTCLCFLYWFEHVKTLDK